MGFFGGFLIGLATDLVDLGGLILLVWISSLFDDDLADRSTGFSFLGLTTLVRLPINDIKGMGPLARTLWGWFLNIV